MLAQIAAAGEMAVVLEAIDQEVERMGVGKGGQGAVEGFRVFEAVTAQLSTQGSR